MNNINQQKLAKLANVSVSTVSKAFSNSKEISSVTREKIFEIAKKYGCFNKYCANEYSKKIIAVIAPELKSNNFSKSITYLDEKIRKNNDIMILSFYKFSTANMQNLIDYFVNFSKINGIILLGSCENADLSTDIPIVSIVSSSKRKSPGTDCINTDLRSSIDCAIKYLKNMGHKDIAYIGELFTTKKLELFQKAMRNNKLKLNEDFIRTSQNRHEDAGFSEMNELLAYSKRPTAVFAAYDTIAFGAINAIKKHGLSVPDDFSVIGMNDIDTASLEGNELTTIRESSNSMCDIALDLLYKRMDKNCTIPKQTITIQSELIVRNSVKDITNI